jgi:hypothetical protein
MFYSTYICVCLIVDHYVAVVHRVFRVHATRTADRGSSGFLSFVSIN